MWPLLWKGIVVFTALAFLSSVSRHRPPKSLDSALLLYYCCCCCFWKEVLYSLCSEKWCSPLGGWAQLPLLLCVCVFNTPVKHRNSDFSGFKVPPFSFKAQPGIFSEPWPGSALPQVPRAAFPQADPCWEFCLIPSKDSWASLSIPSSLVFWSLQNTEVWGENSCQGCLACHLVSKMRADGHQYIFQSLISVPWVVTVSACLVNVWAEDSQILSLSGWIKQK